MNQNNSNYMEIRRFGYFYKAYRPNKLNFVVDNEKISANDLKRYSEITSVIFNLQPIIFALDGVERSYQELIHSINKNRKNFNNLGKENLCALPILDVLEGKLSVSQKINNFLSSVSTFLDRTNYQIERIHGKDSCKHKAWTELRKELHLNSFSYKFMYQLRNYSQHQGFPFSQYGAKGKDDHQSNCMIFETNIIMLRDSFLEDGKNYWNTSTKEELQKQPAEFNILPLITEYLNYMRQLCLKAIQFENEKKQLVNCAKYFEEITSKNPDRTIPVIYIGESECAPPPKAELIPTEELRYLRQEVNRLANM